MKLTKRVWARLAMGAGFVVLAFGMLCLWNKHDYCQGWARHYAARAEQCRIDAANPAFGHEEVREHLIAADLHDMVSRKYAAVASHPWRRYPGYPLVTPEEQRIAARRQ